MPTPSPQDRTLGARYRLDQPDGTWWEVGWDRPLGTFYAQHLSPEPYDPFTTDNLLAWHGTRPAELPTVAALADHVGVAIPDEIAAELEADRRAFPHLSDPPFLHLAAQLTDEITGPTQWSQASVGAMAGPRADLPASQVAGALRRLHDDPYLGGEDIATFARGVGLDLDLASGILDGSIRHLDPDQIAAVCEALHCSPFDLWGPELGRQILDVYGPERWPRHIEPLHDGRAVLGRDDFVRRRIEQQAAEIVTVAPTAGQPVALDAIRYRVCGVLAVDQHGHTTPVSDTLQPAAPDTDYHFAFRPLGEPVPVIAPLTATQFTAGCPLGADAHPQLAAIAEAFERTEPGADMIRFTDTTTGHDQWIGRDTPFDAWQTWDDPRRYYPGDPADVLGPDALRTLAVDGLEPEPTQQRLELSVADGFDL